MSRGRGRLGTGTKATAGSELVREQEAPISYAAAPQRNMNEKADVDSWGSPPRSANEKPTSADDDGYVNSRSVRTYEGVQESFQSPTNDIWNQDKDESQRECLYCSGDHDSHMCPTKNHRHDKSSRTCNSCGEEGHFVRECPNSQFGGGGPRGRSDRGGSRNGYDGPRGYGGARDGRGGSRGYGQSEGGYGGGSSSANRSCQNCGGRGHEAYQCPTPPAALDDRGYRSPPPASRGGQRGGSGGAFSPGSPSRGGSYGGSGYRADNGYQGGEAGYGRGGGRNERGNSGEPRDNERDDRGSNQRFGAVDETPCRRCNKVGHRPFQCPERVGAKPSDAEAVPYCKVIEVNDSDAISRIQSGINFKRYSNIQVKVLDKFGNPNHSAESLKLHKFEDAELDSDLMVTIRKLGYETPTPVQQYAIPIALEGKDVIACAQTGSGKTAAFVIPMMQVLLKERVRTSVGPQSPLALILAPTRELAVQITKDAKLYGQRTDLHVKECYGGTHVRTQIGNISKGCHILVGTTGRVKDFLQRGVVNLDRLKFLVFDEADRMLDMGFQPDIQEIAAYFSRNLVKPQTLMFSATFKEDVQILARKHLTEDFVKLEVGLVGANQDVKQHVEEVSGLGPKRARLLEIITTELRKNPKAKILVFAETKKHADFLASYMSERDWKSTSIHGDRLQQQREEALSDFQSGTCSVMVATSVAARGLDISGVTHVVNFDLPSDIDEYIHRVGRTGRVGNEGCATSFYDSEKDYSLRQSLKDTIMDSGLEVPEFLK